MRIFKIAFLFISYLAIIWFSIIAYFAIDSIEFMAS